MSQSHARYKEQGSEVGRRGRRLSRGRFTIRSLAPLLLAAVQPWLMSPDVRAQTGARPNIVFVMADDLGYGDLGCYGQKQILTPRIDRLASQGTRFTQCYAGSTVCAPSRCSLLTGFHSGHGRVRDNIPHEIFLQPDDLTVAEVLKQTGYRTGAIGKWSLGNPGSWGLPTWQGFDYFYGHLNQDQAHFYYPDYLWENEKVDLLAGNRGEKRGEYTHDLFTEKALDYIRANSTRPFFLYVSYTVPHYSDHSGRTPDVYLVPSDAPYGDRDWPQIAKNYAAMVTRFDRDVGRISDLLEELGLSSNTALFVTSDNGPAGKGGHDVEFFDSNGPLRGVKRRVTEGGIRVPMVVRWPGVVPAGATSDQIWAFWDFLPTAAAMAGVPFTGETDGISMLPALKGEPQPESHEYLYWDYGHVRSRFRQAVRYGKWKGLRGATDAPIQLYDLSTDIGEEKDVAAAHPDVVKKIREFIESAYVPSPAYVKK